MQLPTTLAEQIKGYLKQQAQKGDFEAQALSTQLEQIDSQAVMTRFSVLSPMEQEMITLPPDDQQLKC